MHIALEYLSTTRSMAWRQPRTRFWNRTSAWYRRACVASFPTNSTSAADSVDTLHQLMAFHSQQSRTPHVLPTLFRLTIISIRLCCKLALSRRGAQKESISHF